MGRWSRRGPGGPPVLGLDIGQRSIRLAHLDLSGERPTVLGLAQASTPVGLFNATGALASRDALSECVTQLAAELSLREGDLVTALDVPPALAIPLTLPAETDDVQAAVAAALAPRLPYRLDDAVVCWQELPAEPEAPLRRVMASVAPRGLVESITAALDHTRFAPLVIDLAPFAACHALVAGDPWLGGVTALLVDLGATHATASLVTAGEVREVRAMPYGGDGVTATLAGALGLEPVAAERYKRESFSLATPGDELPDPDDQRAARAAVESLLGGLMSALEELLASAPETNPPETILLYGGGALLRGLAGLVQARLGLPAQVADPLASLATRDELPPDVLRHGAGFTTALGLALRQRAPSGAEA